MRNTFLVILFQFATLQTFAAGFATSATLGEINGELRRFAGEIQKREVNKKSATQMVCVPDSSVSEPIRWRYVINKTTGMVELFSSQISLNEKGDGVVFGPERKLKITQISLGEFLVVGIEGGYLVTYENTYRHRADLVSGKNRYGFGNQVCSFHE